jgi:hypothetical protein
MYAFLLLGFLPGMGHSLEADHLAAVGAMATGRSSKKRLAVLGAAWGLGHTITLLLLCSAVIFFGFVLTEWGTAAMEFAVGMTLVILGVDVLCRVGRARVHFHVHDHGDGHPHIHAHSHLGSKLPHAVDPHDHAQPQRLPGKALLVGMMHGAAGSAGLLALALAVSREPWIAIIYVLLFGFGSICGMTALTCLAAWPLGLAERSATGLHHGLHSAISCVAIVLGISAMLESGHLVWKGI